MIAEIIAELRVKVPNGMISGLPPDKKEGSICKGFFGLCHQLGVTLVY